MPNLIVAELVIRWPPQAHGQAARSGLVEAHREPAQVEFVQRAIVLELDQRPIDGVTYRVMAGGDRDSQTFAEQVAAGNRVRRQSRSSSGSR